LRRPRKYPQNSRLNFWEVTEPFDSASKFPGIVDYGEHHSGATLGQDEFDVNKVIVWFPVACKIISLLERVVSPTPFVLS